MSTRKYILTAINVLLDAAGTPDGPVGSSQAAKKLRKAIKDFRSNSDPWAVITVVGISVGTIFVHAPVGYTDTVKRWVVREMWRLSGNKLATAPAIADLVGNVAENLSNAPEEPFTTDEESE